jgi:hypothetical protein
MKLSKEKGKRERERSGAKTKIKSCRKEIVIKRRIE